MSADSLPGNSFLAECAAETTPPTMGFGASMAIDRPSMRGPISRASPGPASEGRAPQARSDRVLDPLNAPNAGSGETAGRKIGVQIRSERRHDRRGVSEGSCVLSSRPVRITRRPQLWQR
jgi:hypothetical protein